MAYIALPSTPTMIIPTPRKPNTIAGVRLGLAPRMGLATKSDMSNTTVMPTSGKRLNKADGTMSETASPPNVSTSATLNSDCWATPAKAATPTSAKPAYMTPRAGVRCLNNSAAPSASTPSAGMANRKLTGWVKIQEAQS